MPTLARRQKSGGHAFSTVVPLHDLGAHCASCNVRVSCLPDQLASAAAFQFDQVVRSRTRLKKRDTLYRPGETFRSLYAVRFGTFKTVVLAQDGREQIIGYHIAGDVVGLDGIGDGRHECQAIALEDSEVCVLHFGHLEEMAHQVPLLQRNLYRLIARDICRAQDMMFMLGSTRAEERLVLFLLNLSQRYQARGYSSSEFLLRMTREETASYLGLKLETVSRLFSRLQEEGLVQVQGRLIKLLDPIALKKLLGQKAAERRTVPATGHGACQPGHEPIGKTVPDSLSARTPN
jgi:CRP/FNR family transcriptional regulator, anaerobic regulatory protein